MTKKVVTVPEHKTIGSTPDSPNSGFSKIYPKLDNQWYRLDSNGDESPLGGVILQDSGSGSSVRINNCNCADSSYATVSGGYCNTASSDYATVSGGYSNVVVTRGVFRIRNILFSGSVANGTYPAPQSSTTGGGTNAVFLVKFVSNIITSVLILSPGKNYSDDDSITLNGVNFGGTSPADDVVLTVKIGNAESSTINGGFKNSISHRGSAIGGGFCNTVAASYSTISSGLCNNITTASFSTIGGGFQNSIHSEDAGHSVVAGGYGNFTSACASTISGGYSSTISAYSDYSTISGGFLNLINNACYSVISGGQRNTVSSCQSTVSGGCGNRILFGGIIGITAPSFTGQMPNGTYYNIAATSSSGNGTNARFIITFENNLVTGISIANPGINYATGDSILIVGTAILFPGAVSPRDDLSFNVVVGLSDRSTISGGSANYSSNCRATISGGYSNTVSGTASSISGGHRNVISGAPCATISGGYCNIISSCYSFDSGSTISGGGRNIICDVGSIIAGGLCNRICTTECLNTISGGYGNNILGNSLLNSISGGFCNCMVDSNSSVISGGLSNTVCAEFATIAGGNNNCAFGCSAAVVGGCNNCTSGCCSFIGGGSCNLVGGSYSSIVGGLCNTDSNLDCVFIVGTGITADSPSTTYVNSLSIKSIPACAGTPTGLCSGTLWVDTTAGNALKIVYP